MYNLGSSLPIQWNEVYLELNHYQSKFALLTYQCGARDLVLSCFKTSFILVMLKFNVVIGLYVF